jgi:putative ABC transport system permease protein
MHACTGADHDGSRARDFQEHGRVRGIAARHDAVTSLPQDSADVGEHVGRIVDAEDVVTECRSGRPKSGVRIKRGDRRLLAAVLLPLSSLDALLITSNGLYAVVTRSVAERTREMGVRIALGLTPRGVVTDLMRDSARLGLIGLAYGLAGGALLAPSMAGVLLGLSPADPISFTFVPLALAVIIILATFIPARRAARLDAVTALRNE